MFPLYSSNAYLWIWPHFWVVVKAIKVEQNCDTCGAGGREKIHGVNVWSDGQQGPCIHERPGSVNPKVAQHDLVGKVKRRWGR